MDSKISPPVLAQSIWRYTRIFLLALGMMFLGSQDANASHIAGADLTYQCVGNGRYIITLTLYRDCEGIPIGTVETVSFNSPSGCALSFTNATLNASGPLVEVSQLCAAALPNSSCNGGTLYPGMQAQVYISDTLDLLPCSDLVVSWSQCCRNNDITTGQSNANTYIEAMINTTVCNSSPTFTTNPTPYFCSGQCYQFNHGAFDADGDSLIYALTCPLTGAGACAPYGGGFSVQQPLSTSPGVFQFNTNTGQMTFCTTPGLAQQAVVAITVYQIVNGDTVGYVQRDIQMIVLNNANCTSPVNSNSPTVYVGGSFDTTSNTFVVCAGETLQFSLTLSDPDGDTISLDLVNTNLDQVFGPSNWSLLLFNDPIATPPYRPDSVLMFIQINAIPANIGVNQFTIGITDNACPIPGDQILGFNLIIPGVEVTASDTTICPGIAQQIQVSANSFSTVGALASGSFDWVQLSGPPVTFSNDTIRNPLVNVPASTTDGQSIVLAVTFTTVPDAITGTQCVTVDSVTIFLAALPLSLSILATDTTLCANNLNDTISLAATIFGPGINLFNGVYNWTATPASYLSNLTSTSINNPDAILQGSFNDSVTYTLTYTYGACIGSDQVHLTFNAATLSTQGDTTICSGDTIQISSTYTSLLAASNGSCGANTVGTCSGPLNQYVVGGNTSTTVFPYRNFWEDGRCQTLYRASELTAAGVTAGLLKEAAYFIAVKGSNQPFSGFTIKIGCTSLNQFTTNQAFVPGLTQVYTGNPSTTNGWNNYVFQTPYEWDGVSNLIVEVCFNNSSWFDDDDVVSETTPFVSVIEFEADGVIGCVANAERTSSNRPRIRFANCPLPAPVQYAWSPPVGFLFNSDTLDVATVIPQATLTYRVSATDGSCTLWDSVQVTIQSNVPSPVVTCGTPFNQATSILFEWGSSPGATGWEYSLDYGVTWIPAALQDSSLLITGLTNGDCSEILVRATGGGGPCPINGATYAICCTTPCPMPNTSTVTNLTCNGTDDGTISIAITGGVLGDHPDYTATLYNLSGAQIGTPISTPNTAVFTGLLPGTYYAYLTDTFGCFTNSDTVVITEPNELILSLDSTTLTTCFTTNDGTASVMGIGGTGAYDWQWSANANNQTTMTATGLVAGIYQVILTDANGCADTLNVGVYSPFPAAPALSLTNTASTTCIGNGTATVFSTFNLVGNANNFTYLWSNNSATGPTATGLTAGVTSLTVTDENGCTATANVSITGNPSIDITAMNPINPGCGATDGQISAVVTGDAAGYSYQWTANAMGQTTALVTGLPIGTFTLIVVGLSNGCTDTATTALVNNSALDIVGFNVTNPSCGNTDGEVTVLTTGAVGTLVYNWSNAQATNPATGLGGGVFTVTVTDPATNCSDIGDTVLVQYIPTASFATVNQPACNLTNGSITTTVSGGIPSLFTYLWSPNNETTSSISGLAAGTYGCTITYQGCEFVLADTTLTNETLQIQTNTTSNNTCDGAATGSAEVIVTSGSGATPTFLWSNGATTQTVTGLTGAPLGGDLQYFVTATLPGCPPVTGFATITNFNLSTAATIGIYGNTSDTIPLGTSIGVSSNIISSLANPIYSWSVGTSNIATLTNTSLLNATAIATDTGQTWIYFTATLGPCGPYTDSVLLVVDFLNIDIIDQDTINCNGVPTAYANVTIVTGNNVSFLWSNGATTQNISGLAAGVYTVTATSGSSMDIDSVIITNTSIGVDPWVVATGTTDVVIESNNQVVIDGGISTNFVTPIYSWTIDSAVVVSVADAAALNTVATGNSLGSTWLYFTATAGPCVVMDSIHIKVEQFTGMPTAFTPNGDGINDVFGPAGINASNKVVQFKIYNRWGQLMYSDPVNYHWDGTYMGVLQPQDYYIYVFEYAPNGGSPTLVRGEFMLIL